MTGYPVGPVTLYFGARHRHAEFLYGDELEAAASVPANHPTHVLASLRLAFSRDSGSKVYIQHLMEQDGEALWQALGVRRGSFYLCGPTWPEADVRCADAVVFTGKHTVSAPPATPPPPYRQLRSQVEAAVVSAFVRYGGMTKDEAVTEIRRMKDEKRYVLEVY